MLVGLTGGIGSGKTAVSDAFALLGAPVVDTDIIARQILTIQPSLNTQLANEFGDSIFDRKGNLIRAALRKKAFKTENSKAVLDGIMHPAIRQETLKQIKLNNKAPYSIVVVPLLIETNFKSLVDRILVVTAPIEHRLNWLKKRSGLSKEEAQEIISKQTSDTKRISFSDDHIINDGSLKDIENRVAALHKTYLSISSAL